MEVEGTIERLLALLLSQELSKCFVVDHLLLIITVTEDVKQPIQQKELPDKIPHNTWHLVVNKKSQQHFLCCWDKGTSPI